MAEKLKYVISAQDRSKSALRSVQNNLRSTQNAVGRLTRVLAPLATVFSAAVLGRRLIETNKSFQTLQASLTTFTGSVQNGQRAFNILQEFASETPFALREVVSGFNTLISRGIKPTIEDLQKFGDIAAGAGKSFDALALAVANASVGEFETLKQFGIKANKEQDKIRISFGNTTQVIENKKDLIVKALTEIATVNFSGGTERQAKTLSGAFSNFGDAVDSVMFAIGEAGLNKEINRVTRSLTKFISKGNGASQAISNKLVKSIRVAISVTKFLGRNIEQIGFGLGVVFGALIVRRIATVVKAIIIFAKAMVTAKVVTVAMSTLLSKPKFFLLFAGAVGAGTVAIAKYKEEILETLGDLKLFELVSSASAEVTDKFTRALGINTDQLDLQAQSLENTNSNFLFAQQNITKTTDAVGSLRQEFGKGAIIGVENYFNSIKDNAKNATTFVEGAFQSLESSLSEFFQTGKLDFNSFRDAIKKGLADLGARTVISVGRGAIGGLGSGIGGAIGSAIGGIGSGILKKIFRFNSGGSVPNIGSPNKDSILAGLTAGEFVVNASASKKFRPLLESINGYNTGGVVGSIGDQLGSFFGNTGSFSNVSGSEIGDAISLGQGLGATDAQKMGEAFASASNQGIGFNRASDLILNAFGLKTNITGQINAVQSFAQILGLMGIPMLGSAVKGGISLTQRAIRNGIFPQRSNLQDFQGGQDLIRSITADQVAGIASLTANSSNSFVSALDKAFNKLVNSSSPFLEARAGGGNVSAGQPYLVGENGAEIFTPNLAGNITPNSGETGIVSAVMEVREEISLLRRSFSRALSGGDLVGSRV